MAGEASDSAGAQGSRPAALADAAGLATATPQRRPLRWPKPPTRIARLSRAKRSVPPCSCLEKL